ncbi:DUF494 family protein [Candidatus Venteria ishoeyi]|uniref:Protein Smg homolog n=1 Tax=Candidatus Venteria ishoeyi TaxID=1899563 RepID=A0A1H6FH70_9GAMM|nr:DUF494 family protein [Candidatus Venteria ishoeyi]MDM8545883.1 DUF494 family protein [Candidatus Venteria ishoeyi]SEH08344.1 Uncharacterised protein [Candidatus Venteria ishoeyi]
MKENTIDILMYLFEHYADEESQIQMDHEMLKDELSGAGFSEQEINKAFDWLEVLADRQTQSRAENGMSLHEISSIRLFHPNEIARLSTQSRGFLLFLEQMDVLDHETRELIIDRAMALDNEEINLDQLKWVCLMVLFNQPGLEEGFSWMEKLVYDETPNCLH